jgi:putative phosphoribosyl transferase
MNVFFSDRINAGKKLGHALEYLQDEKPIILALPRGGVIVADEVAKILNVSMDVVVARKIGAPGHPEYGIGAISEDEVPSFNKDIVPFIDPHSRLVHEIVEDEMNELRRRVKIYRGGHQLPEMKNRTVIVVDDGLATGVTAYAAAKYLRTLNPKKLILAVPVGPVDVNAELDEIYDEILCLHSVLDFHSVGTWYQSFEQVEDSEVLDVLKKYH